MELKPGYKQTEVGMIPEDWEVRSVRDFAQIKTGPFGTLLKAREYSGNNGVPLISVGEVGAGRFKVTELTPLVPDAVIRRLPQYLLRTGDVVFGRKGAVERSALVTENENGWFLGSDGISIRPQLDCHPPYLACQFQRYEVQAWLLQNSTGSTMASLNQAILGRVQIANAPLPEQRSIATALNDVDAMLSALERLIAKKRDIKQATMQELLTGKRRLPGFEGEWEVASLDILTSRATGVWGKNEPDERSSRIVEIVRAGDISQDGRLSSTATRYVAPEEFEKAKCALDDLVITTSGNGLGKLWWSDGRSNIVASNFVRVLHPKTAKVVGRFLYYALRTREGLRQLQEHTATSAYPNLRPTYFSTSWIPLPAPLEQVAIAAVLSDMDAELVALEDRRDKTGLLKQGMMQELLTGRIRLV